MRRGVLSGLRIVALLSPAVSGQGETNRGKTEPAMDRSGLFVLTLILALASAAPAQEARPSENKEVVIISSGFNAPDTVYLSRNTQQLERVPLDGVATWIATPTPIRRESGDMYTTRLSSGRLCRIPTGEDSADVGQTVVWPRRLTEDQIAPAIADLKSATFKRFKSNFIHIIMGNARSPMDWFDDAWWEIICHNIGKIAGVAHEGGCRGILIDPEVYSYSWWSWALLTETQDWKTRYRRGNKDLYKGKTVEQVMEKVRQRGREFARGINGEFPDPAIMFFHAAGYAAWQVNDPRWDSYKVAPFGLMGPFIDGILEGSTDRTVIVDATSQAKWWTERRQLQAARKLVKEDAAKLSQVGELYKKKVKVGFCYRLDYHPDEEQVHGPDRIGGLFNPEEPESNFFSPAKLLETLKLALEIGDGYVLFWNATANWWLDSAEAKAIGGAPRYEAGRWVPRGYWRALEQARASVQGKID